MLPDCECKGRAFLHSLQDFAEKNCEKISFAPILPLHSIAKSAVKPIFSPLPHPTFFAPKSPFFALFSVSNPISGDFSRKRSRFCPVKSTFFSSCLVLDQTSDDFSRNRSRFFPFYRLFPLPFSHFESNFRRFFEGASLFSAPKLTFSLLFPVLPHTSGTSSRDLTHYFPHTPFLHSVNAFPIRASLILHALPHLPISIDFLSALHSPLPLCSLPTFFLIPPHFSIFLPNKRTIARPLTHYARTRTPAPTHTSGGFRFYPSPLHPPSTTHCVPMR